MTTNVELCVLCDEPTGGAGCGEDSLYCDICDIGPLCEECWGIGGHDEHDEDDEVL